MTSALGEFREGVSRHVFVGGNFFVQRMLNRYRGELGVVALPAELEGAAARTVEHLQSKTARIAVERLGLTGGVLNADIFVENLAATNFHGLSLEACMAAREGARSEQPDAVRIGRAECERVDYG